MLATGAASRPAPPSAFDYGSGQMFAAIDISLAQSAIPVKSEQPIYFELHAKLIRVCSP